MGSVHGLLFACLLLFQSVRFAQSRCGGGETGIEFGDCSDSKTTYSHVKTESTSSSSSSESQISKKTKSSRSKTAVLGFHRSSDSGTEESSYSYKEHHSFSSSSKQTHRISTNSTTVVSVTVRGEPLLLLPKQRTENDVEASESTVSVEKPFHVIETETYHSHEADAPQFSDELSESVSNRYDNDDDALEEIPCPAVEDSPDSIPDILSVEPVVVVEALPSPSPSLSPSPSPSPSVEPKVPVEVPVEFYPCGYPKPVDPGHPHDPNAAVKYYATPDGIDCPVTRPKPEPVVPQPDDQPEPLPVPVVNIISPPSPSPIEEKSEESVSDSKVLAKRVRDLIETGNITGLAEIVIESEDIYGLNMGLRFSDEEREDVLEKTEERTKDKDVVVLKALATAALSPEAKGKVIQLMVVTATAPDGYNFSQHRDLVERFEEIFSDDHLLEEVIGQNPREYPKRRLLCAGCTPVNSYICAHCWPNKICQAYFWCAASRAPSTAPSKKSETDEEVKTDAEFEEPAAVSEPAPRSRSIESDNERAGDEDVGKKSSNVKAAESASRKEMTKEKTKSSTKSRRKHRNRKRGQHRRSGSSSKLRTGSNKDAHRDQ